MDLAFIKSMHIIFVVTWFAGLFYIVRLFIYDVEAASEEEAVRGILQAKLRVWQRKLWYGITWPSMVLTLVFGGILLFQMSDFIYDFWMQCKLFFVAILIGYHLYCHRVFLKISRNSMTLSSMTLRYLNEVATVLLFLIVFAVVFKQLYSYTVILSILGAVGILLILGIYMVNRKK